MLLPINRCVACLIVFGMSKSVQGVIPIPEKQNQTFIIVI